MLRAGRHAAAFPDRWDPRVTELVAFVEAQRGLRFRHPVTVDFLDEAVFLDRFKAEGGGESQAGDERFTEFARAIGVADGGVDVADAARDLTEVSVLAWYSFEDQRITVRGTTLDVAIEVTVVHELTHALQDQHFDLDELTERAINGNIAAPTPLIEGDATRIEWRYIEELSTSDRADYDEQTQAQRDDADVEGIPLFLQLSLAYPYAFGPHFVTILDALDGNEGVDAAFADPPTTEEMYFDPRAFRFAEPATDPGSFLFAGGEVIDSGGEFGPLSWYLMLSERVRSDVALEAVLGWGGDRYRQVLVDGDSCVQLRFVGDRDADTDEMESALRQWRTQLPHQHMVTVRRDAGAITVEACDPGDSFRSLTTDKMERAFGVALVRLQMIRAGVEAWPLAESTCVADRAALELPVSELLGTDSEGEPTETGPSEITRRRYDRIVEDCTGETGASA